MNYYSFYKTAVIGILLVLLYSSCNPTTKLDVEKIEVDTRESTLKKDAINLYCSLYPETLRNGDYVIVKNISHLKKSSLRDTEDSTLNIGICAVNFENNKGFAIMTTGDISTPIAIIDRGNIDLNKDPITVQDSIIFGAIDHSLGEIIASQKKGKSDRIFIEESGAEVIELIEHKLKTKLNQTGPYFYPYRPTDVAGCVPVALAQILIYYKTITWKIKGRYINWQNIEKECIKYNGEVDVNSPQSVKDDLNELLWWIGLNSGANYGKEGTSTYSSKALRLIEKNGFVTLPNMYNYNIKKVRSGLLENKLSYMHGSDTEGKFLWWHWPHLGHAWVADGYAKIKDNNGKIVEMIHINWGWGKGTKSSNDDNYYVAGNGYFRDNVFYYWDPNRINTLQNLRDQTPDYYKYGVEMTHVYPK